MKTVLTERESFQIFGWKISEMPPKIKSAGHFAPTPTKPIRLGTGKVKLIPKQEVSTWADQQANLKLISTNRVNETGTGENKSWVIDNNGWIDFELNLPIKGDVDFSICVKTEDIPGSSWGFIVWVNDKEVAHQQAKGKEWKWVYIKIPLNVLKKRNKVAIGGRWGNGIILNRVLVDSPEKPIFIDYFWTQVASVYLEGAPKSIGIGEELKSGDISITKETREFVHHMNIEVKANSPIPFVDLGSELTSSFSSTHRKEHTITIYNLKTNKWSYNIPLLKHEKSRTVQVWQIHLLYTVDNKSIVQAISDNEAPLRLQEFVEEQQDFVE